MFSLAWLLLNGGASLGPNWTIALPDFLLKNTLTCVYEPKPISLHKQAILHVTTLQLNLEMGKPSERLVLGDTGISIFELKC
jgi:hypothetical protein